MGQSLGKGCLAITAGAFEPHSDRGNRIALDVEEASFQCVEFPGSLNEIRRWHRRRDWHALLPAVTFKDTEQHGLVFNEVEVADLPDPSRKLDEVVNPGALNWTNGLSFLSRQPDFPTYEWACERSRRNDKNDMPKRL